MRRRGASGRIVRNQMRQAMPIDINKIPIFCINLDSRPHRYKKFSMQPGAKEILPKVQRFPAVDGYKIDIFKSPDISLPTKLNILRKSRRSHGDIDSLGAIGCSMSHYQIWQKFLAGEAAHCLVLEDDAWIPEGFTGEIAGVVAPDFDVWALSYRLYDKRLFPLDSNAPDKKSPWKTPVYYWGTAAYIVSRQGAQKLSEGFFPIANHLDQYFCMKNTLGYIRLVVHEEVNIPTLSSGTDIQLHKCDLCDLPDVFDNEIVLDKRYLYGLVGIGVFLAILLRATNNG